MRGILVMLYEQDATTEPGMIFPYILEGIDAASVRDFASKKWKHLGRRGVPQVTWTFLDNVEKWKKDDPDIMAPYVKA